MPRRSSGGRPAPRAASRPAPMRNPPQPASKASPPAPVQSGGGSMLGGLGATVADGMAFGTGSAIAHRAVDSVMGPRVIQHENVDSSSPAAVSAPAGSSMEGSDACSAQSKAFQDCINTNGSEIGKCQFYLDMLSECRRMNSGAVMGV